MSTVKKLPGMPKLTVTEWYRHTKCTEEEARGAFKYADSQAWEEATSIAHWLGMDADEYNAYMRNGTLPPKLKHLVVPVDAVREDE